MQDYEKLKNEILEKIDSTSSLDDLEGVRVESLGKKGSLSLLMKQLGSIDPDKRRETGQKIKSYSKRSFRSHRE
jgi:phenylalanyl-tRNA synthetase alpha chain